MIRDAVTDYLQFSIAATKPYAANPSWPTPYFACLLVAIGMIWQFGSHLIGFARKQQLT